MEYSPRCSLHLCHRDFRSSCRLHTNEYRYPRWPSFAPISIINPIFIFDLTIAVDSFFFFFRFFPFIRILRGLSIGKKEKLDQFPRGKTTRGNLVARVSWESGDIDARREQIAPSYTLHNDPCVNLGRCRTNRRSG